MSGSPESVAAVAVLSDALRRRIYEFIRRQPRPVSRDEAAEHVGISRRLAAFHLDKLTRSGLLRSHYGRPEGAAGRPGRSPKLYEPADAEFAVSIPARQYDLIGEILLDAIEGFDRADDAGPAAGSGVAANGVHAQGHAVHRDPDRWDGAAGSDPAGRAGAATGRQDSPRAVALRVAEARGAAFGATARTGLRPGRLGPERALSATVQVLEALGYEPVRASGDMVRLRNCPFHRLATRSPDLVCGINHAFVGGLLCGLQAYVLDAELDPGYDRCCVTVCRRRPGGGESR